MNNSFILGCHIDVSFFRAGLCLPSVFFLFRGTENLPEYVGEHSSSPKARICSNNIIIVFTFYINKKNTNYILHLSCGTRHETCFIADSTNEIPQTQPLIGGEVIRQICGQSKGRGGRESRFSPLLGIFGQFGVPG